MKTPYSYQTEVIREISGRSLLALDMGLGKTAISLWWLEAKALPALVICPATVKYNWEVEARDLGLTTSICEGQTPPDIQGGSLADDFAQVVIINYEILRFWLDYFQTLNFKTIIVDECQNFANPYTLKTKAGKKISQGKPYMLALSGTPLLNRPIELFPTLQMLWPEKYKSLWSFAQSYCNPRWTPWGWDYKGSSNTDQLHKELLSMGMIRRRKDEVLKDLPKIVRSIVPCQLSDEGEYQFAKEHFIDWLKQTMRHRVRRAAKVEKLAKVGYMLRLIARLKFKAVAEWSNRYLEEMDEKLILFAVHQKMIEALARRVNGKSVVVDGSVTGSDRQAAVEQFQKDKRTRVFIGSRAAWAGITLTAASTIGITELYWRPGDHSQAEARPHRIGQQDRVWANYLIATGTMEDDLCKLLQLKQKTISSVLDGGPTQTDLNLYDELLSSIEATL